jgi:hypothetical protein
VIPCTTEHYKKCMYAVGMHRVRRLYDSVGGSRPGPRDRARPRGKEQGQCP